MAERQRIDITLQFEEDGEYDCNIKVFNMTIDEASDGLSVLVDILTGHSGEVVDAKFTEKDGNVVSMPDFGFAE